MKYLLKCLLSYCVLLSNFGMPGKKVLTGGNSPGIV